MASRKGMIKTFQLAFNQAGFPILYHTTQFYSLRQNRPVTQYHLKKVVIDEETGRSQGVEIFSTYYQMYLIFFLRDLWDYINGRKLDTSNLYWEEYKKKNNVNIEDVIML